MDGRILVVDDEPLVLSTIERALEKVGYTVRATSDVEMFLDELGAHDYDLFIMDVHIRGMDVSEKLMSSVMQKKPSARVLTISGSIPNRNDLHFLQKPFKIDELRKKVKEILDEL